VRLTAERLREVLHYDHETGVFTWKVRVSIRIVVGKAAGVVGKRGYVIIGLDGGHHYAHRLAWLYMTGRWPDGEVDHEDRMRTNNRWKNLRAAPVGQNAHNSGQRKNNTSGVPGVSWDKKRGCWIAKICINRKQIYLGSFGQDIEAAKAEHRRAQERLHPFRSAAQTPSHSRQEASQQC
jgi:hypothetical protein